MCVEHLVLPVQLHALLEAVGNSALPASSALSEGNRATKGTSSGAVADAHDTDVGSASNGSIASHASGHLNLHLEVGVGRERETLDTKARNVLSDGGGLHSRLVGSTRCAVNIRSERTSAVLVDLAKGHCDGTIIGTGGKTGGRSSTSCSCNASLRRTVALCASTAATKEASETSRSAVSALASTKESAKQLTLLASSCWLLDVVLNTNTSGCSVVGRGSSAGAHESSDHDRCVNRAVALSAAERSSLSAGNVTVTDDGSVCLGTAAADILSVWDFDATLKGHSLGRAVTGSAVLDGQTRHGDSIGALDLSDYTVGRSAGRHGRNESDLLREVHFERIRRMRSTQM